MKAPAGRPARWSRFWLWLVPFAVVFALYGRVLSLPLYWDDARHYSATIPYTYLQIWLNQTGYGYYRPAIFTFYKFAFTYLTPQLTFLCYGVALVCHALNSVLAGQLAAAFLGYAKPAGGVISPRLAGLVAALLFAAYPFSLFAIANFASLMHPIVTFWALVGVLAALRFVQAQKRRWWAAMLLSAVAAPWFHESGVVVAAIIVTELVILNWRLAWQHKWSVGLLVAAAGLFVCVWLWVPKTRGETQLIELKMMLESSTFFLQGLTFPLQPLATLLMNRLGWWEIPSVRVMALPGLLALGLLLWRNRQWRAFVFGLAWFGMVCAPSIAFLYYWYIIPSPRLLYEIAPVAALVWTLGFAGLVNYIHSRRVAQGVFSGLALATLAIPVFFIGDRLTLFQVGLDPLRQLASLARAYPTETHLVINPSDWVATVNDLYPLGRWGVEIAPDYVLLSELVSMNAGLPARFDGVHFPGVRMSMEGHNWRVYHEGDVEDWVSIAAKLLNYDHVWLTTYAPDRIAVEEAGAVKLGAAARPSTYLASFEDKVFLTSATYAAAGRAVVVTLNWKYLGPDPNATIFRHVFDCAGQTLGIGDGHFLGRVLPFGFVVPGADVRDVRRIPVDAVAGDGCYALEVGLYRSDGSRVPAVAPDGTEFENEVVPVH